VHQKSPGTIGSRYQTRLLLDNPHHRSYYAPMTDGDAATSRASACRIRRLLDQCRNTGSATASQD